MDTKDETMKPPTPSRDLGLVHSIIASQPRLTIPELSRFSGFWTHELASITKTLHDSRLIEARGDRLYVRERKKKSEPVAPGFWSRLINVFASSDAKKPARREPTRSRRRLKQGLDCSSVESIRTPSPCRSRLGRALVVISVASGARFHLPTRKK
jgi:hypothetical protein